MDFRHGDGVIEEGALYLAMDSWRDWAQISQLTGRGDVKGRLRFVLRLWC